MADDGETNPASEENKIEEESDANNNDDEDDDADEKSVVVNSPKKKRRKKKKRKKNNKKLGGGGGYQQLRSGAASFGGSARRREMAQLRISHAQNAFHDAINNFAPVKLSSVWANNNDRIDLSRVVSQRDLMKVLDAAILPLLVPCSNVFIAFKQSQNLDINVVDPCSRLYPLTRFYVTGMMLMAWTRRISDALLGDSIYVDCLGRCSSSWTNFPRNILNTSELVAWIAGMKCGYSLSSTFRSVLCGSTVEYARKKQVIDECIKDIFSVCVNLLLAYSDNPSYSEFCQAVNELKSALEHQSTIHSVSIPSDHLIIEKSETTDIVTCDYQSKLIDLCKLRLSIWRNASLSPMEMMKSIRADPLSFLVHIITGPSNETLMEEATSILFGYCPDDGPLLASWLQCVAQVCSHLSVSPMGDQAQLLLSTLESLSMPLAMKESHSQVFKEARNAISQFISQAFASSGDFVVKEEGLLLLPGENVLSVTPLQSTLNKLRSGISASSALGASSNILQSLIQCSLFSKNAVLRGILQLAWNSNNTDIIRSLGRSLIEHIHYRSASDQCPVLLDIICEIISSSRVMDDFTTAQKVVSIITVIDEEELVDHNTIVRWIIEQMKHSIIFEHAIKLSVAFFSVPSPEFENAMKWMTNRCTERNKTSLFEREIIESAVSAFMNTFPITNSEILLMLDPPISLEERVFACSYRREPLPDDLIVLCKERMISRSSNRSEQEDSLLRLSQMVELCAMAGVNAESLTTELMKIVSTQSQQSLLMALASVLACSTAREFETCSSRVLPVLTQAIPTLKSSKPSLLFESFWLAHQPSTRTLLEKFQLADDSSKSCACLSGRCDCAVQSNGSDCVFPCEFFNHLVKILQTWPSEHISDAIECHRCACLLHRCCKTNHSVTTESLCVVTLRAVLSFSTDGGPSDMEQLKSIHQQTGVASDPKLVSLFDALFERMPS